MDFQQLLGFGIAILAIGVFASLIVGALFLYWATSIAGVPGRTFGKAFLVNFLNIAVSLLTALLFGGSPVVEILVYLILSFVLIMAVFSTTFGKAVLTWILQIVLAAVVVGAIALVGLLLVAGMR